jgi:hypothetical protein
VNRLDSVPNVLNIYQTIQLVCVAALAAGCSGATHSAGQQLPTVTPPNRTTTTPTTPAARAAIRTLRPVAKLTAACTLLSAAELKTLLGGGASRTKVTATEDKPDPSGGHTSYTCEYGSNGKKPFALTVLGIAQDGGYTPKVAIDAVAKSSGVKTYRLTGVGEAAVFYTAKNGYSLVATGKRSHGQTRTVNFAAPAGVPERKFVDVAKLVISRV